CWCSGLCWLCYCCCYIVSAGIYDAAGSFVLAVSFVSTGYVVTAAIYVSVLSISILLLREDLSRNLELTESTPSLGEDSWELLKRLRFVPTDRVIQFLLMALCVPAGSSSCDSAGRIEAVPAAYVLECFCWKTYEPFLLVMILFLLVMFLFLLTDIESADLIYRRDILRVGLLVIFYSYLIKIGMRYIRKRLMFISYVFIVFLFSNLGFLVYKRNHKP
nr:hypothetical protein [Tanacetum cinerariifolium]